VWLKSFDEEQGLNAQGRSSVYDQTLRYAVGRLRIEDLLARHPEILQVKIVRPLLIAGLPRSGTTHLVNVLGTSPELRSVPSLQRPLRRESPRPTAHTSSRGEPELARSP
jgi:hypothetical protein